jgi:L-amino acid N-acyltransferase YncA
MCNLIIRAAQDSDFDAIWEIFHPVVKAGDTYPFAPETDRKSAHEIWMQAPLATYVAASGVQILGTYYIKANMPGLGSHVCNAGYMVSPASHNQGVGRAMCAHSLDQARKLGFKAMQYNLVVSTNLGAVSLWEKMGFEKTGLLPKAFNHSRKGLVDAWVMYRLLDD